MFGIKIFEIDMLMIFDLLTLPQGHLFDPRIKMLLTFCSACIPVDLICHMTMFQKTLTPWAPPVPLTYPLGMTQAAEEKNPV